MRKQTFILVICVLLVPSVLTGCAPAAEKGALQFYANGEDFVRQGFVSKDGWAITFDHVYITLADVTAYQSDPPYDPHAGSDVQATVEVGLDGTHTVDLAEGGADVPPILVGEVQDVAVGHYNAVHWKMARATDGPASGYSLVVAGTAEKEGQTVNFVIEVEQEYEYTCGEYVGDERKGFLEEGGPADVEMTFHFDHIFGDAETPLDDELNIGAPGFEPFAGIVGGAGALRVDMSGLQAELSAEDYQMLVDILPTLGHVGEGHCHCE
ncbi:MAG: DUF4382 domain-containing protein [Chloroflexota bacterium]|nr:DUF4382 domain-containing protein [Chloroflexota bacterium]